jgi:hypothetical protein
MTIQSHPIVSVGEMLYYYVPKTLMTLRDIRVIIKRGLDTIAEDPTLAGMCALIGIASSILALTIFILWRFFKPMPLSAPKQTFTNPPVSCPTLAAAKPAIINHNRIDLGDGFYLEQYMEEFKNGKMAAMVKISNGLTSVRFSPNSIVNLLTKFVANGCRESVESGRVALLVDGSRFAFSNSYKSTIEMNKNQFNALLGIWTEFDWDV